MLNLFNQGNTPDEQTHSPDFQRLFKVINSKPHCMKRMKRRRCGKGKTNQMLIDGGGGGEGKGRNTITVKRQMNRKREMEQVALYILQ
jgi:hypothetical protein